MSDSFFSKSYFVISSIFLETLFVFFCFFAFYIFDVSFGASIMIMVSIAFVFMLTIVKRMQFPDIKEGDAVILVIAPKESDSKLANKYLQEVDRITRRYKKFKYVAIGTNSLKDGIDLHLICDISEDVVQGVPSLRQFTTNFIVYYRLSQFVGKNKGQLHNIITYTEPYHIRKLYQSLEKKITDKTNLISIGIRDYDLCTGKVSSKTVDIVETSSRMLFPFHGGKLERFFESLNSVCPKYKHKFLRCYSAFFVEGIDGNNDLPSDNVKDEIVVVLGSNKRELNRHIVVGSYVLEKFYDKGFKIVFLATNNNLLEYIRQIFGFVNFTERCPVQFCLEEDYDFSRAKFAVYKCFNSRALTYPVVKGVPVLPFYIFSLRTKVFLRVMRVVAKFTKKPASELFSAVIPNLIAGKDLLPKDFLGSIDKEKFLNELTVFSDKVEGFEDYRVSFAKNYLGVDEDVSSFNDVVSAFNTHILRELIELKRLLLKNVDKYNVQLSAQGNKDLVSKSKLGHVSTQSEKVEEVFERSKFDLIRANDYLHNNGLVESGYDFVETTRKIHGMDCSNSDKDNVIVCASVNGMTSHDVQSLQGDFLMGGMLFLSDQQVENAKMLSDERLLYVATLKSTVSKRFHDAKVA